MITPLEDRFWAKVDKNGPVPAHRPELGACWIWTGSHEHRGYGRIGTLRGRTPMLAHRVAFELQNGEIPPGHDVLHHCDRPACVRGSHLFSGTKSDNMRDCVAKGRAARKAPRGEGTAQAKLTDSKVKDARERFTAGSATISALARENGVHYKTMREAVLGIHWKHVA